MKKINITENERNHYIKYADVCGFKTAEEEYDWAETQRKQCNKCNKSLPLTCFGFSTSGSFPFNKNGIRYRRGECLDCGGKILQGKNSAKTKAKNSGLEIHPPKDAVCVYCQKETKNLVFDHNHLTNEFRGWLCDPCNRAIGTLESRGGLDWFQKLKEYTNK